MIILDKGLTTREVEELLKKHGPNHFGGVARFSKFKLFVKQFRSPLIFILIIAGAATLLMQHWVDSVVIFLAIGINAFLGFYQENRAENALADLRSYIQERTRVIRDGKEAEVDAANIVPGDLIHLMPGSRIPADARIESVQDLNVDESILTGESLPVEKSVEPVSDGAALSERYNMVFGGTLVSNGSAYAVVTATGNETEIGKIAQLVEGTERELTPIQKAISRLAWIIAAGVLILVVGIFILGFYRGESVLEMFLISIAVAVGAIPEALPIGLTAVLAVGVERLAKRKGIMRDLTAAETLGSTTVIMTDKTGTLTLADMQLVDIVSREKLLSDGAEAQGNTAKERFSLEQKDLLYLASLNTDVLIENPEDEPQSWRLNGNPLEKNIVKSAALHGISLSERREKNMFQMLLPFNSSNKFSISRVTFDLDTDIIDRHKKEGLVVLGAPDVLLARSLLSKDEYLTLVARVEEMSLKGRRILGVAVASESSAKGQALANIQALEFLGVLAFYDPIRPGVIDAIKKIESYGVRVVIATGDIKGTALAVARGLGWSVREDSVLSGDELRQIDDRALEKSLEHVRVFARMTPEDKLRVARMYQRLGEVVAMTGDGVNDAPSLKAVDIGIAVGSGTDVAKGVADLVLLDDNFAIIVVAIEEGKRILRNIRKTFVYLLSNSLDEVVLIGGSLLAGLALPLTAIQIIWVNLFTGSLPAVAFAFDPDNETDVPEKKTEKKILNSEVKLLTLGIGTLSSLLLFVLYWSLMQTNIPEEVAKTFLFACFSSYILFVSFSFRSLSRPIFSYNIFSNSFLVGGVSLGLLLLLMTIYVPFLQPIFSTTALGPQWLMWVGVWVVLNVALVEFAKWLFYRRNN
ncbi:MAG: HAD-IC family P-type ATPase [Candidatus Paceibacterota bacterium]